MQLKRADFIDSAPLINPENLVFLDESGSNLSQTRDYARSKGGSRVKMPKPCNPGKKFSIIGAISMLSVISVMYTNRAVNGDIFRTFIESCLIKHLKPGQFVVMDNISFHKQKEISKLIESVGAKVVFLPPYSPDLSPIEKMWSKIKETLKRYQPRSEADFHNALAYALHEVNPTDLEAWYAECGYEAAA